MNPRDGRLLAPYAKAPFDANAMPHTLAEVGHYITSEVKNFNIHKLDISKEMAIKLIPIQLFVGLGT